jgi:hypothetical protein
MNIPTIFQEQRFDDVCQFLALLPSSKENLKLNQLLEYLLIISGA